MVKGQHDVTVAAAREATEKQALGIAAGGVSGEYDEPDPLAGDRLQAWLAAAEVCWKALPLAGAVKGAWGKTPLQISALTTVAYY